jgi:hypothetical protein
MGLCPRMSFLNLPFKVTPSDRNHRYVPQSSSDGAVAALVLVLNHRQRDDQAEQDITESQEELVDPEDHLERHSCTKIGSALTSGGPRTGLEPSVRGDFKNWMPMTAGLLPKAAVAASVRGPPFFFSRSRL